MGCSALSPTMCSSSGPLTLQVDPQMQTARKINENWQLYLIMQPSAMCLQQTLFLRRVIILGAPLWVRLCFGNWFWILDSFLFEPPCWNPFYQCLWAEAEVLFPRDKPYRTSCFCSSCGALGRLWVVRHACLAFAALLRGLYLTPLSHILDYSLSWLDHSCTWSKDGPSALSPTLRWLCSNRLRRFDSKTQPSTCLLGWIQHATFTLPPSYPNPTPILFPSSNCSQKLARCCEESMR